jgi:hypothetical protein
LPKSTTIDLSAVTDEDDIVEIPTLARDRCVGREKEGFISGSQSCFFPRCVTLVSGWCLGKPKYHRKVVFWENHELAVAKSAVFSLRDAAGFGGFSLNAQPKAPVLKLRFWHHPPAAPSLYHTS